MTNMKWYNISAAVLLAGAALAACTKLDTEPTGNTVTSKQKEEVVASNPEMVSASVSGITAMFSVYQKNSTAHSDFGYPAIMLFTDSRGRDLVSEDIGYNWFGNGLDLISDRTFNYRDTRVTWNTLYNQIYSANQVIMLIDPETEDSTSQYYLGQALTIRAFDYFILAQMYQLTYKGHESSPCVPLILDTNADDAAANGCARSTVQQVYDQIMSDLNKAVTMLEATAMTRPDKRYVDASVAHGLRARVELVMQDYAAAATDAAKAIELSTATPKSIADASKPSFKDMTEEDWMWGIAIAETDRVVTSGIVNWPSHMGSLNYGYASVGAWRRINKSLFNAIPDSDVRKGWFLDADGLSKNLSAEQQDYVTNTAACPAYTQVKFGSYKDEIYSSTNACDIPLMRIEEMYLIQAEALAKSGNAAQGSTVLKDFVTAYRNPSFIVGADAASVADAVDFQRRVELWGEGLTYYDVLRLGQGLDRRGAGFQAQYVFVLEANDPLLIYQIPNTEIQANKLISESDNNPNATTPTPVPDVE